MLKSGLYEQLINKLLRQELSASIGKVIQALPIDPEEAPRIISKYLAEVLETVLSNVKDNGGSIQDQVVLANHIVALVSDQTAQESLSALSVDEKAEQLFALFDKENNIFALNDKAEIVRPVTSLAASSLFTGAVHEPSMFAELKREILSCDRIDMLVSFIKWSGLRLLIEELKMYIFFITLNKSDKDYSPTTLYHDYSINDRLFHWQSQSTTSADSPTGQRYIHHQEFGSKVLLFVREYKSDATGAAPYTFLGLADYVKHEGSRPMNIIWRLHEPIPAKFIKKTNKLIVG
ncbi:DUF3427 domain-containing protein [Dehalobacter sp. DCM]|nr:DUF3427 domain-containing protein [Dehalobacter sp. DCM]